MLINYRNLIEYMYGLGVHIGSSYYYSNADFNNYTLGIRRDFQILDIKKSILYLKRITYFIFNLSFNGGNIYYYYSDFFFLKGKRYFFFYNKLKKSSLFLNYIKPKPGSFTNYRTYFLDFLSILMSFFLKKSKDLMYNRSKYPILKISFFKLFISFLNLLIKRIKLKKKKINIHNYNIYWRCLFFIRNFKYFTILPDSFILLNIAKTPINNSIIFDFYKLRVPIIALLDRAFLFNTISYPLPSNSDSFIVSFFFFSLFKYFSLKGRLFLYENLLKKRKPIA